VQAKFVTPRELKGSPGKLVFTNGCFDILHAGHLSTLNFAKSKGDRLVVAVNSDASVSRLKPGRPFTALEDRMRLLASLEIVDYVVSFEEDNPKRLIEEVQPDVLVKGGDYVPQDIIGSDLVEEVYAAPLVADLSTTNLVERIKNS
jgi:D-beta-D-heptose 7-phosphate kinase/D-beta-D-heptose 1-phosphate adenosyltransferase